MNEQTIDEIMKAVFVAQYVTAKYEQGTASKKRMDDADDKVRHAITAALAAKDAEIERLKARIDAAEKQEPVAEIRTWHKSSAQHADLMYWCGEIENLPDGEHLLYVAPVPAKAAPDGWRVTAEMVRAGEMAWAAKKRDMSSPTPTEFPEGGPAEACFLAMLAASPEAAR